MYRYNSLSLLIILLAQRIAWLTIKITNMLWKFVNGLKVSLLKVETTLLVSMVIQSCQRVVKMIGKAMKRGPVFLNIALGFEYVSAHKIKRAIRFDNT